MRFFCSPEWTCQRWRGPFYLSVPTTLMLWSKQTSIKDEFSPASFLPCVREYLFIIMLVSVIKTLVQMRGRGMSGSRCSAHGWVTRQRRAAQQPRWAGACRACCQAVLPAADCWGPLIHWMNKARIKDQETSHVLSLSTPLLSINPHTPSSNKNADIHTHNHLSFSLCFLYKMTDEGKKTSSKMFTDNISEKSQKNTFTVMYFRIYFFCNTWSFPLWNTLTKK